MPSLKSDKNNSTRIIFTIISIIKVNIVNICIKNTHSITNKYGITRIFFKVEYIFIRSEIIMIRNNSVTHFLSFILIRNIKKCKKTFTKSFITHFLSLLAFRNKLYCRRMSIGNFITHFFRLENINNPSTNPFLFLVELSLLSTRAFSKLHFFFLSL